MHNCHTALNKNPVLAKETLNYWRSQNAWVVETGLEPFHYSPLSKEATELKQETSLEVMINLWVDWCLDQGVGSGKDILMNQS